MRAKYFVLCLHVLISVFLLKLFSCELFKKWILPSLSLCLSQGLHLLLPNGKLASGCQKKICFHTSEKKEDTAWGTFGTSGCIIHFWLLELKIVWKIFFLGLLLPFYSANMSGLWRLQLNQATPDVLLIRHIRSAPDQMGKMYWVCPGVFCLTWTWFCCLHTVYVHLIYMFNHKHRITVMKLPGFGYTQAQKQLG